jgi:hypothetical protein
MFVETTVRRIPSSSGAAQLPLPERQVDVPKSAGKFATVIDPSACKVSTTTPNNSQIMRQIVLKKTVLAIAMIVVL